MRPAIKFLNDELIEQIISEAMSILCEIGIEIHNEDVLTMLGDHGADIRMDTWRPHLPRISLIKH